MKYRITHLTRYEAREKISMGMNQVYLTPRNTPWQTCEYSRVLTSPPATSADRRTDYFGNIVNYFSFERGYQKLEIRASSRVAVQPRELLHRENSLPWDKLIRTLAQQQRDQYATLEMTIPSPMVHDLAGQVRDYARVSFPPERPILACLEDLLSRFRRDFTFDNSATTLNTPVLEVFEERKGVCQDFAHLAIAMLRALGIPARYVSGYLRTYPKAGQPRLRGADASHAWVGVYCGSLGWVDIDPTNDSFVSDEHITVAWGRDYSDVAPVRGVIIGSGTHALDVSVDVEPITPAA